MRKILSLMMELRQLQLKSRNAPEKRIGEVGDMFRWIDTELSGLTPTSETDRLAEVMTSADFTYAIQEFVQRQMLPGYMEKTFAFEQFVKPDTLPNYMNVNRYQRRAGLDDLEYVGEKGSARPGSVVDATKRQYRVYRFEKQYDFSMEALVNDDLGYFSDLATEMGRSARRSLEKYVSRMLWNATTVARLVALGALFSTTGRLTTARISTARMAFSQRTDDRSNPIVASLRYIVHHSGLIDTVAQIQSSTLVPELATNANNVVRGTFVPIEDPHLAGTAPNLPWMALTDYRTNGIVPLVLARLTGRPGPIIMRKRSNIETVTQLLGAGGMAPPIWGDFETSNIVLKVADVWGTYIDGTEGNMFDNKGLYYSSGTAA